MPKSMKSGRYKKKSTNINAVVNSNKIESLYENISSLLRNQGKFGSEVKNEKIRIKEGRVLKKYRYQESGKMHWEKVSQVWLKNDLLLLWRFLRSRILFIRRNSKFSKEMTKKLL